MSKLPLIMSAISKPLSPTTRHLRPFDVSKDLTAVAGLVEACFANTLDEDGRRYVSQMHAAARNPRYLRWAMSVADNFPMPFSGYVWEENGYLAGNLSLIPYKNQGRRCYLIANVAVDPAYRRKGIARALTNKAIEHARKGGADEIWLHVRDENTAAQNLYRSLGFKERAQRTTWEIKPKSQKIIASQLNQRPNGIEVAKPQPDHWAQYRHWLDSVYPPQLTRHQHFNPTALRPGLIGSIYRFLTATQIQQWATLQGDQLIGVLAWQPHSKNADHLWLACSQENDATVITALAPNLHQDLVNRRRMLLDFPAGRAILAFHEAGFHIQQTLIWMQLE